MICVYNYECKAVNNPCVAIYSNIMYS